MKYTYVYKITLKNVYSDDPELYYIGIRSCYCLPENDVYMGTPSTYKHFWNDKKYLKTKEILSWGYYEYDNERLLKEEAEKIVQHLNDYGIYKFGGTCLNVNVFRNSRTEIKDKSLWKINQKRGIKKAKEKGVYKGRKISIDTEKVLELKEQGLGATAIARYLGIGRASVYRVTKK